MTNSNTHLIDPLTAWCDTTEALLKSLPGYWADRDGSCQAEEKWRHEADALQKKLLRAIRASASDWVNSIAQYLLEIKFKTQATCAAWRRDALEACLTHRPNADALLAGTLRRIDRFREMSVFVPRERLVLTVEQREVWELLENCAMTAKEIAKKLKIESYNAEDVIHGRIHRIRAAGWVIEKGTGNSGYYRPDAPPEK